MFMDRAFTNSPGYKRAADYAKATLESWGLQQVHFDTWEENFGTGWQLKKFSLQNLSPVYFPVIAYPKAWSPGVKGTVKRRGCLPGYQKRRRPRQIQGQAKGKIVLFSLPTPVKPGFVPDATRFVDSTLLQMANSGASEAFTGRRFQAPVEP